MYQSDIDEIYKGFFTTVRNRVHMACPADDFETDTYNFMSEVIGMVRLIEELVKEEEK